MSDRELTIKAMLECACGAPKGEFSLRCRPCRDKAGRDPLIVLERAIDKISVSPSGCMEYTGHINKQGYGRVKIRVERRFTTRAAHRVVYEGLVGPVPPGLQLDHLCRNRRCVNPSHLEVVSGRENVRRGQGITANNARKSECLRGHPLEGSNLYTTSRGSRQCRICQRQRSREFKRRKSQVTT